ncbi:hypothetical protein LINPERHAP2_LOCUS21686 [Linum perenne]
MSERLGSRGLVSVDVASDDVEEVVEGCRREVVGDGAAAGR